MSRSDNGFWSKRLFFGQLFVEPLRSASMQLELGPTAAGDVRDWARFARRLICEIRVEPDDFQGIASPDLLNAWSAMIDALDSHPASFDQMFRWTGMIDVELAEYLLHGLHRCVHSEALRSRITDEERARHAPFTLHLIQSFVDGLTAEGSCHLQLVDQIRTTLGQLLDH